MSELANSPHCQQLNGQNLASFHNGKHTFQTLSAETLEAEMPTSANAFRPNELMRERGAAIPDWTQMVDWISA